MIRRSVTYAEFILIVALSSAAAVGLSFLIHRLVHIETRRRHQEVGTMVFLQLGVLFAVLLAFVFSEAYSEYGEAQQAIDLECGALHAAAMIESTLPAPEGRLMLHTEGDYIRQVIQSDWREMRDHRRGSPKAVMTLTELMQAAARLPVADTADEPVKAQLLELLAIAHAQREVRLYQAQNGLPMILWVVLIGFSLILMVFVAFSSIERYLWLMLFGVTFALCVSAILALVGMLNYPFEGALGLTPADFIDRLADVVALTPPP
jgi:uncharacterized membrane protein